MRPRSRLAATAAALAIGLAATAAAQEDRAVGSWSGRYTCNQGVTGVTLTVEAATARGAIALFHFYADPSNPGVPSGCFRMSGRFDARTGRLQLKGGRWLLRPYGYLTVDFTGEIDPAGETFVGQVTGYNCTRFELSRRPAPVPVPAQCFEAISSLGEKPGPS